MSTTSSAIQRIGLVLLLTLSACSPRDEADDITQPEDMAAARIPDVPPDLDQGSATDAGAEQLTDANPDSSLPEDMKEQTQPDAGTEEVDAAADEEPSHARWQDDPPADNIYHNNARPGPGASARYIGSPCVVRSPLPTGSKTLMYYAGTDTSNYRAIYVAGSDDGGLTFRELGLALPPGEPGAWDDEAMDTPFVIWDERSGRFLMWYMGNSLANEQERGGDYLYHAAIGMAASEDGITWTRVGNEPVFAPDPDGWDSYFVTDPAVVREGDTLHMAYSGMRAYPAAGIGLATSQDGITWTRVGDAAVVQPTETWSNVLTSSPSLHRVESGPNAGTWLMWFQGTDRTYAPDYNMALGGATAHDFTGPWTLHPDNPMISWPQDPATAKFESWYIGPINVHVLATPPSPPSQYERYVMYYETAHGFGRIESVTP